MRCLRPKMTKHFIYLLRMLKDAKDTIVTLGTGDSEVTTVMSGVETVWGGIFTPRLEVTPKQLFLNRDTLQGDILVLANVKWDVS